MNESIKEIHNLLQEIVEHLGANTWMECARRSLSRSELRLSPQRRLSRNTLPVLAERPGP